MHTRDLKPLKPGMKVILQNQHGAGKIAKKWDRTGLSIDDLGHNKYRIKVDGSGRVTDRNRQFTPHTLIQPGPRPGNEFHPEPVAEPAPRVDLQAPPVVNPEPVAEPMPPVVSNPEQVVQPAPQTPQRQTPEPVVQPMPQSPEPQSFSTPPTTPIMNSPPRRSTRVSKPPERWGYEKF